jgi:hypothetical protein
MKTVQRKNWSVQRVKSVYWSRRNKILVNCVIWSVMMIKPKKIMAVKL